MGAATNVDTGVGEQGLAEWSFGYIYLPAFVGIVISSSLCAKIGVKWAHSLPGDLLKKIFACFLALVAARFLLSNLF
jgi:uncharacterized membrane protein YfcA